MNDLIQAVQQAPKPSPCDTCNAGYGNDLARIIRYGNDLARIISYGNDLARIIRCGTCVVRPGQMPTKWGKNHE